MLADSVFLKVYTRRFLESILLPCAGMDTEPLQLFFAAHGLESRADFAFLFKTREEAADRGGPIIAAAWEVAAKGFPSKFVISATCRLLGAKASIPVWDGGRCCSH